MKEIENNLHTGEVSKEQNLKKNVKNHASGHRQRLKEKLIKHHSDLPDYEILELLLTYAVPRKDTKPLAKELLERFGSIKGCILAKETELESMPNIGQGISSYFLLLREVLTRYAESTIKEKEKLTFRTLEDFINLAHPQLSSLSEEEIWGIFLDTQNRLISFECLCKGGIDQVQIQSRTIIEVALKRKASGLVIAHNHPGGNRIASPKDREFTQRISNTCESMGIRLHEHFIITEKGCTCILAEKFFNV